MATREWLMSERNLADEPIESLGDMSDSERDNLALLVKQCRGWSSQDIEEVVAVMAEDGVYHDITLPPAVGHDAIRAFGAGWLDAVPDLSLHIEAFCVQSNVVCDMGWMSGTITKDYFGLPGNGQCFDCQFSQVLLRRERQDQVPARPLERARHVQSGGLGPGRPQALTPAGDARPRA